jgi:hypothetical protein
MTPAAMTVKSPGNTPGLSRAPGAVQPVRLTQAARQEYEEYVQSRLRAANQQPGPRLPVAPLAAMGGPPGTVQGLSQTAVHTIITQGVCFYSTYSRLHHYFFTCVVFFCELDPFGCSHIISSSVVLFKKISLVCSARTLCVALQASCLQFNT